MTLSKNRFLLLLLVVLISPIIAFKLVWIANSTATLGKVYFRGNTLELDGSISSHLVILFKDGNDSITFNAPSTLPYEINDPVPVRYQKSNVSDARVNIFHRIWGDTLVYALWPFCVLAIIFLIPEKLDPILPKNSKVVLGKRPFIRLILPENQ